MSRFDVEAGFDNLGFRAKRRRFFLLSPVLKLSDIVNRVFPTFCGGADGFALLGFGLDCSGVTGLGLPAACGYEG
ncbi:hypothetical protein BOTNAR_0345g00020 [Botryotinia narcissicola]|uniref:Uncharacterized protein n=1 Tax=Botryotinia narcissicola TaxID=278944 RepID=A0A4Z1HSG6_9HELO|nr:hypothetical protein BOTNAR_0345g00020 [Botryotinia narcissicola]